jgi:hypothetical protein
MSVASGADRAAPPLWQASGTPGEDEPGCCWLQPRLLASWVRLVPVADLPWQAPKAAGSSGSDQAP